MRRLILAFAAIASLSGCGLYPNLYHPRLSDADMDRIERHGPNSIDERIQYDIQSGRTAYFKKSDAKAEECRRMNDEEARGNCLYEWGTEPPPPRPACANCSGNVDDAMERMDYQMAHDALMQSDRGW